MSLMIVSCMYNFFWRQAHLVNKKHFSRYDHSHAHILRIKSLYRDERLLCESKISGKTNNYYLRSVCFFAVTWFYLIWLCKQHNRALGTDSIEMIFISATIMARPKKNLFLTEIWRKASQGKSAQWKKLEKKDMLVADDCIIMMPSIMNCNLK